MQDRGGHCHHEAGKGCGYITRPWEKGGIVAGTFDRDRISSVGELLAVGGILDLEVRAKKTQASRQVKL